MRRSDGLRIVVLLATGTLVGVGCSGAGGSNGSKGTAGSSSGAGGSGGSGGVSDGGGAGITSAGDGGPGTSGGKAGATANAAGADGSDASSDAPLSSCLASQPSFGTTCTGKLSCEYGHSSCCGIPSSEMTCVCSYGFFVCSQTVECNFICKDAGTN